ncbi:carbon-phosphorus lyase complex subunit PhnI [Alicyclobacillus fastidiosus]|uniref:Carbon-phosphorus lyase complex subunit PhnI n=1 Tax=Alicyclobacillus fastidiosus TaxID=392011 RepID=A0ABY6ZPQ6_9BACL|nr:carbon-phosphorus lyase complex subunit PhnI [Alicyclobacillus fastidiosus]WAH44136.1 carbon-phosphorus lyase complex subunit PhnI [Alicyclobacillus fastidiosus]GMA60438.1 carbon-phosphorus lyase complex subunit PhnI [Alicyclobacillus fastidiosus]
MAYVAVRGGQRAIDEAEQLTKYYRVKNGSSPIEVKQIRDQMRLAVDRVMSEGSLYAPDLAAIALKQAEGDTLEASFLLRAFRSTLPRNLYSLPVDTTQIRMIRRVSATFKDIPGGQFLGPTRDYTKRLIEFSLSEESEDDVKDFLDLYVGRDNVPDTLPEFPRVVDLLRAEGLLENRGLNKSERVVTDPAAAPGPSDVGDITRQPIRFPASRAVRMQSLSRGEQGALLALAYSSARGYGFIHPTLGELRVGYVPVEVPHPIYEKETITVGWILVTEAEIIARMEERTEETRAQFSLGYGFCFGHNDVKAMSMATLDRAMVSEGAVAPAEDEEFVLYHIDGIESSGFVSHWKLPHYVDFQAEMNRVQSIQERRGTE